MATTIQPFGVHQGQEIQQYVLTNKHGMMVKIINYGATVTSLSVPGTNGLRVELVAGFDRFSGYFGSDYQNNAPYFGCTVGRYASRIKDGVVTVDGRKYALAKNDGPNHLHGGQVGFDKRVWSAKLVEGKSELVMSLQSRHMDEGYPGNLQVSVHFILNDQNELMISYTGKCDQTTPVSLTNHSYFNLSGFTEDIRGHTAEVSSSAILMPDDTNVPNGEILPVGQTPADLRSAKVLDDCFQQLPTGFEHFYLFDHGLDQVKKVATFTHPSSQRQLRILTSEPGAMFYSGYFTSDQLRRENGDQYGRYRAFCFETSRYPNGPNLENSPGSLTRPGEQYSSTTIFKFSW